MTTNRALAEKIFAYVGYGVATKAAQEWCKAFIAAHAKAYRDNGAEEVCIAENGMSFRTDGGDFAEARWDWVSDAEDADIVAKVDGSW